MIKQLQLKEFGDLLALFIEALESFLAASDQYTCSYENKEANSHRFTFSISGEMEGYLVATTGMRLPSESNQTVCSECVAELIEHINQKNRIFNWVNLRINIMNIQCLDQFLYSVRQRGPKVTISLKGDRCKVVFYAFTNKQTALPEYKNFNLTSTGS